MEDLIAALASWLVRAIGGRRPADRLGSAPARPATPPIPPVRPAPPPQVTAGPRSRTPAAKRPAAPISAPGGTSPEVPLVRALFATPQTLGAAFVAAEILGPPVALR
jgi:hypothetical protein